MGAACKVAPILALLLHLALVLMAPTLSSRCCSCSSTRPWLLIGAAHLRARSTPPRARCACGPAYRAPTVAYARSTSAASRSPASSASMPCSHSPRSRALTSTAMPSRVTSPHRGGYAAAPAGWCENDGRAEVVALRHRPSMQDRWMGGGSGALALAPDTGKADGRRQWRSSTGPRCRTGGPRTGESSGTSTAGGPS